MNNRRVDTKHFHTIFSVQHECIPQAVLGMDIICQAKSGMGKTAVFVLATLHQVLLERNPGGVLNIEFLMKL